MPEYSIDPDGDNDEACPPSFTEDSDTIHEDDLDDDSEDCE